MQYTNNMLYSDDQTLKGDASVVARGAVSLMQLETLQLRRNEFLTATANPMDSQIVGLEGRAEILREVAKGLQMDINKVVPKKLQQPVPQQAQPGGQQPPAANQETLQNGAAVTDNFSPNSMRSV
jgi:TolA-binding protein